MKSSLFRDFKTDEKKLNEGVKITYRANEDGTIPTFIVSRLSFSNAKYKREFERVTKPRKRAIDLGQIDEAEDRAMMVAVFVKTILLGWENVLDADGKPITFTEENAKHIFAALPELYLDLAGQARDIELFRVDEQEASAKNL
jgi:hypothetical protein